MYTLDSQLLLYFRRMEQSRVFTETWATPQVAGWMIPQIQTAVRLQGTGTQESSLLWSLKSYRDVLSMAPELGRVETMAM